MGEHLGFDWPKICHECGWVEGHHQTCELNPFREQEERMAVKKAALKDVCAELEGGKPLSFEMVGRVFGDDFWMLIVYALMDAQDAARAIQGAIGRLREGDDDTDRSEEAV